MQRMHKLCIPGACWCALWLKQKVDCRWMQDAHILLELANRCLERIPYENPLALLIHAFEKLAQVLEARIFDLFLIIFHLL